VKQNIVLLLFLLGCCTKKETPLPDLVISNAHVVDVINGNLIRNQDVTLDDDYIQSIKPHAASSRAKVMVDGTDLFLIPGLWDMHVHIHGHSQTFLPLFMAFGVTGIRDLHNMEITDFNAWKKSVGQMSFAPRLGPVAGKTIDSYDGWAKPLVVTTEKEAREAVRKNKEMGSDFIKIYDNVLPELIPAIIDECKKLGMPYAGHYLWGMDLRDQADLGFRSIEHLDISLSYAKNSEELLGRYRQYVVNGHGNDHNMDFFKDIIQAHQNRDPQKMGEVFRKLKATNTWQCTAVLAYVWNDALDYTNLTENDLGLQYYPDSLAKKYLAQGQNKTPETIEFGELSLKVYMDIVNELYLHKVPLLAGGHPTPMAALPPGITLHRELLLMQQAGIPSSEVLKTTTINAAKFMNKQEELGSVSVGKLADLVLLRANPLEDIKNINTVQGVFREGLYFDRDYIDSVLNQLSMDN